MNIRYWHSDTDYKTLSELIQELIEDEKIITAIIPILYRTHNDISILINAYIIYSDKI